jgi:hypothetical protein
VVGNRLVAGETTCDGCSLWAFSALHCGDRPIGK